VLVGGLLSPVELLFGYADGTRVFGDLCAFGLVASRVSENAFGEDDSDPSAFVNMSLL
jgi:hypothetical protein